MSEGKCCQMCHSVKYLNLIGFMMEADLTTFFRSDGLGDTLTLGNSNETCIKKKQLQVKMMCINLVVPALNLVESMIEQNTNFGAKVRGILGRGSLEITYQPSTITHRPIWP